jgi:CRISPR-associated protein Csm5
MFEQERDALATRYRLHVRTMSPVHVGSGEADLREEDLGFLPMGDRLAVLDPDKLAASLSQAQLDRLLAGVPLNEIVSALRQDQLEAMAAYTLPTPAAPVDRIRPHIKIPGVPPRPYLPGSSIKGALRTALAWAMLEGGLAEVSERDLGHNRFFADSGVERALFGRDPNHDLLRALHIGDTAGLSPGTGLTLAQVAVYSIRQGRRLAPKGSRFRFHLESLPADLELEAAARRDNYLLEPEQARRMRWDRGQPYLLELVRHANAFAARLMEVEGDFYGPEALVEFYERLGQVLSQIESGEHACLCQIAWGTGWTAKSVGTALDDQTLALIRRKYRLGRQDTIFPKTRRLVEEDGQPNAAPGWLLLIFQPEGDEIAPPEVTSVARRPVPKAAQPSTTRSFSDLRVGQVVEGRVTNTTHFGAFVDIGVRKDGLIHISKLTEGYVRQVEDVVRSGDRVQVEIISLDAERQRIGLRLVNKMQ